MRNFGATPIISFAKLLFCFGKIYRNRQVISSGDSAYRWALSPISTVNRLHFVDMYLRYSIYATHSIYHCVIRYIPSRRNKLSTATAVEKSLLLVYSIFQIISIHNTQTKKIKLRNTGILRRMFLFILVRKRSFPLILNFEF